MKTAEEIAIMQDGGNRLMKVVDALLPQIKVGQTTEEIDKIAEQLIERNGGEPSFKRVPNYFWSTCLPINEQVVHTPPSKRRLEDGDVLTVDIGMYFKGFHTDYATTLIVGQSKDLKKEQFLRVGQEALEKAVAVAKSGNHLGEISRTVQEEIYKNNYFILKELTGHGVGRELHEDPYVPNFVERPLEKTYRLRQGLVIAIEVIYSMGTERISYEEGDDWSIRSRDKSLTACFEKTVAITDEKTYVLT